MNSIHHISLYTCIVFALALSPSVHAAKSRWKKNTPTASISVSAGVAFSRAKLSAASRSVTVSFFNLDKVSKVSYLLTYTGSGQTQGVGGAIAPSGATEGRDLYFGTCSKGVCTPHYNIKTARLLVTTTLKSGGTYTKRYLIRPKW